MQAYSQQQLHIFYDALPASLKDVMRDKTTITFLANLARKYLPEEKQVLLRQVTYRVLAGILPIQKFRATIQEELQIPEEQARAIAYEVRDKIFAPVAEELRELHGLNANSRTQ